jgi:protoporphyrinogen oxidase
MTRTIAIAGAGPAGLTAAFELQRELPGTRVEIFDLDTQVGGISKTVNYRGNRMDLGGHRFFSKSDWVMDWWQKILPVEAGASGAIGLAYQQQSRSFEPQSNGNGNGDRVMLVRPRLSRIFYRRKFFDYPVKLNANTLRNLGLGRAVGIGMSYMYACAFPRKPEKSLEDFFINRFGDQLYRTFFKDYTEKVWGVSCQEIDAEWGAQRVKGLSITKALLHAVSSFARSGGGIGQKNVETSLIEQFLYPKFGPGQMWETVAEIVERQGGHIHLRHKVVGLQRRGTTVTSVQVRDLATGQERTVQCDALISTLPLAELVKLLQPEDAAMAKAASGLPYRDFMTAGLVVRKMESTHAHGASAFAKLPPDNWIYIQEPDVRIGRLQIFNNWSPALVADPNTVSLGLEYFCNEGDDLWSMADGRFLEFAAGELEKIGLIKRENVLDGTIVRVPKAYPAYFGEYREIGKIRKYLEPFANLFPVGRNGMHRYNNQDHSMLAARAAVECIVKGSADKRGIWDINSEDDYHETRTAA